jgi:tetratricopeptide (TPR) repeat protein
MKKMANHFSLFLFLLCCGTAFSQKDKIDQSILDGSCECIKKIDFDLPKDKKHEEIKSCIGASIMAGQMKSLMSEMKKDTDSLLQAKIDTTAPGKSYTLYADKDYDAIEKTLLAECSYMKTLLMAYNEKSKNSISNKAKAKAFYDEGDKYFVNEKYDLAMVEYNKAVKADPKFAFAWDNLGMCYRKLSRYKEAIECYNKSIEVDPKGQMPLLNKAMAYALMEDYKNAATSYEKLISVYPEDAEGYYGAGRSYFAMQEYEKGLDNIFQAYMIYKKTESPYIHDAESNISAFYGYMKQNNLLETFNKVAKKYNIEIKE